MDKVLIILFTAVAVIVAVSMIQAEEPEEPELVIICIDGGELPTETTEPAFSGFPVPLSLEFQEYINGVAREYDIPVSLVFAIISTESGFNGSLVSTTHDYGYMQVNRCNRARIEREMGITDLLNPRDNIKAGCFLFAERLRLAGGDMEQALVRYNCGDAGALKLKQQGIISTKYSRKVLSKMAEYEGRA